MLASLAFVVLTQSSPTEKVKARLDELFAASTLPGLSACVITKDGTVITLAKGHSDEAKVVAMTPAHRFLAGSTGKTFFAALAMQLEREGVIDLSAKLSTHLGKEPWFSRLPNHDAVTLTQLMHHQSGIPEHLDNPDFAPAVLKDPMRSWSALELVAYSLDKPALFKPGEGWSYSDTNYILLAMAIEKKTGKTAYGMIKERFIEELGLTSTEPSINTEYMKLANGFHSSAALFAKGWSLHGTKLVVNPQFEWAGGGFVTNPRDLAVWIRSLVSGDVLDTETRTKMQNAVPAKTGRGHEYAYGLMVRPSELGKSYGHGGWYPGYITDVQHFPDLGVTVCVMANTDDMAAFKMDYQRYCVELAKASSSPNQSGSALPVQALRPN